MKRQPTEVYLLMRISFQDVRNINMLREASEVGAPAPACFAGIPTTAVEAETEEEDDWVDQNIRIGFDKPPSPTALDSERTVPSPQPDHSLTSSSGVSVISTEVEPSTPSRGRRRSSTVVSLNPSPVRPINASQNLHVSGAVPPVDDTFVPRRGFHLTGRKTIQLLLNQLTTIHERQQTAQKAAWDGYLKKRRGSGTAPGGGGDESQWTEIGFAQMGNLGKVGREDQKEFHRLVRGGIPIVYRPKIWAECSGAWDVMAPGDYADLLARAEKEGVESTVLAEIEKDVVRTLVSAFLRVCVWKQTGRAFSFSSCIFSSLFYASVCSL